MNKIIHKLNYILLFLISIAMLYYSVLLNIKMMIALVVLLLLGIFHALSHKDNKDIANKMYDYMLLITNIVVTFILIREVFDTSIPMRSVTMFNTWSTSTQGAGMYLDFNMPYIIIMYLFILLYLLINRDYRSKAKK